MKLTKEQMKALRRVWEDVTGARRNMSVSCGVCILNLLKDVGRLYFDSLPKKRRTS